MLIGTLLDVSLCLDVICTSAFILFFFAASFNFFLFFQVFPFFCGN
jgi:hypothetical protein